MFENSIFKIEFSILLGLFPHHNLYRLTFQSFVLREYISGLSEKVRRICREHNLLVSFKLCNTLQQKLVYLKDKPPRCKQSNIVCGFQCKNNACDEINIGETKQPMHKCMYQHRRPRASESTTLPFIPTSTLLNTLMRTKTLLYCMDKEHRWFERGVKEAIYVRRENSSLNKGGGLRHNLPKAYNAAIKKSLKDSLHMTIQLRHKSVNRPEEASRMRCDSVAIKNSKSRRLDLFNQFVICLFHVFINFPNLS